MNRLGRVWVYVGKQIGFLIKIKSQTPGRAQEFTFTVVMRLKGLGGFHFVEVITSVRTVQTKVQPFLCCA